MKNHWLAWGFLALCVASGLLFHNISFKFDKIYKEMLEPGEIEAFFFTSIAMSPIPLMLVLLLGSLAIIRDFKPGTRKWLPPWLFFICFACLWMVVVVGWFKPLIGIHLGVKH